MEANSEDKLTTGGNADEAETNSELKIEQLENLTESTEASRNSTVNVPIVLHANEALKSRITSLDLTKIRVGPQNQIMSYRPNSITLGTKNAIIPESVDSNDGPRLSDANSASEIFDVETLPEIKNPNLNRAVLSPGMARRPPKRKAVILEGGYMSNYKPLGSTLDSTLETIYDTNDALIAPIECNEKVGSVNSMPSCSTRILSLLNRLLTSATNGITRLYGGSTYVMRRLQTTSTPAIDDQELEPPVSSKKTTDASTITSSSSEDSSNAALNDATTIIAALSGPDTNGSTAAPNTAANAPMIDRLDSSRLQMAPVDEAITAKLVIPDEDTSSTLVRVTDNKQEVVDSVTDVAKSVASIDNAVILPSSNSIDNGDPCLVGNESLEIGFKPLITDANDELTSVTE